MKILLNNVPRHHKIKSQIAQLNQPFISSLIQKQLFIILNLTQDFVCNILFNFSIMVNLYDRFTNSSFASSDYDEENWDENDWDEEDEWEEEDDWEDDDLDWEADDEEDEWDEEDGLDIEDEWN